MNTPTDSLTRYLLGVIEPADFEGMAIRERNDLLDDIRLMEETAEMRAEERRNGTWAIPTHVRQGLL